MRKKNKQNFITMVLDVVELRVLLINHDHHLSNALDYVMKQPMKIVIVNFYIINSIRRNRIHTIGTSDGCSKPRFSKLIEQIASQNCGT